MLISDTVGFIQKLPTKLIASFRATLDELSDATLVMHVVDASSPLAAQQVTAARPTEPEALPCAPIGPPSDGLRFALMVCASL